MKKLEPKHSTSLHIYKNAVANLYANNITGSYIKETECRILARPTELYEDTFDLGSWIELSCLSIEIAFCADVIVLCSWELPRE